MGAADDTDRIFAITNIPLEVGTVETTHHACKMIELFRSETFGHIIIPRCWYIIGIALKKQYRDKDKML